jgi:tryptophan synthase alpha chain
VLESYLRRRLKEKDILLMTHIVLGYPAFENSYRIVETMVEAGVDMMELQIPFSEPIADGPAILHANQHALKGGATVEGCLDFLRDVTHAFDIPFIMMSYYNILFKYGVERFVSAAAERAVRGFIIPDLPPEEGGEYLKAMRTHELVPVFIFSPTTSEERMRYIDTFARGFIYCVARKGVTGMDTTFSLELDAYLGRCRGASDLPLAIGFGVKEKADVDFLKGKADIAVIGTQTIRLVEKEGVGSVRDFLLNLH